VWFDGRYGRRLQNRRKVVDRQGLPVMHGTAVMQGIRAVVRKIRMRRGRNGRKMEMQEAFRK